MHHSVTELTTNLSAATLSINNVSDALGLNRESPFSLQVINKFTALAEDNEVLHSVVKELKKQRDQMISEIKSKAVMDAVTAVCESGAVTFGDAIVAMVAYSASLTHKKSDVI